MLKINLFTLTLMVALLLSVKSQAIDTVKMLKPQLGFDKRSQYKGEIIVRSLEVTEAEYGAFAFEAVDLNMTPSRALASIKSGKFINVNILPANKIWDESTITIKVPIRLGLLSYRLLLVNKLDLAKYEAINTLDELNQLTAGLHSDWETTKIYKKLGMNFLTGHHFEGLFSMLNNHRFDYIPRAIYEIYDELNSRKAKLNNVVIEPTLALYIPMVTYTYVSPNEPRLAKRVAAGLRKLIATGELNKILEKYYADDLHKGNLKNRRIIEIKNPYFDEKQLLNDHYFLFKH